MSQTAKDFIKEWVSENVSVDTAEIEEDVSRAETMAAQCRADAKEEGIVDEEFEDAIDDLTGGDGLEIYIEKAINAAIDDDALEIEEKDD